MRAKLPILFIIPHGGTQAPEELSWNEELDDFDLFFESDACANELFSFGEQGMAVMDTQVSRLYVDLDRPPYSLPPRTDDGVVKKETPTGKRIYPGKSYPDEIAIANILKRYYLPYHRTIEKIIASGEPRLIIECHTMMAVGPRNSHDPDAPRPLVTVSTKARRGGGAEFKTCPDELARELLRGMEKALADEDATVAERFLLNNPAFEGHILPAYGGGKIPMLRLSISRSLFLNDRYFNYSRMKVDALRLQTLRKKIWGGIERFFKGGF